MINICAQNGNINSVVPCTEYLTFGPWIYLVPQFKPKSVLMLGYAGGTTAGLMRKLYGDDFPIVAVDIEEPKHGVEEYCVDFVQKDAREYMAHADNFEVIIVDLFIDGQHISCPFIQDADFADMLKEKGDYLIFNLNPDDDMSAYDDVYHVKSIRPFSNYRFEYYMPRTVTRLPIR